MPQRDLTVILGAGPGLGAALARRFAAGGSDIALVARNGDKLSTLADDIAGDRDIRGFPADMTDLVELQTTLDEIADTMGPPTILIHNASRWIGAKATELDPRELAQELTLGPVAAFAASHAVLPAMAREGRGTILWTGSKMGLEPETAGPPAPALAAAKTALRGLALASASAFHEAGINFATITIDGAIKPGTPFDPDKIARAFWSAHTAPREAWRAEHIFTGA